MYRWWSQPSFAPGNRPGSIVSSCAITRGLPHFTTNDIDVLVDPGQLRQAEQALLGAAAETGFRLHNRVEFATLALYLVQPAEQCPGAL